MHKVRYNRQDTLGWQLTVYTEIPKQSLTALDLLTIIVCATSAKLKQAMMSGITIALCLKKKILTWIIRQSMLAYSLSMFVTSKKTYISLQSSPAWCFVPCNHQKNWNVPGYWDTILCQLGSDSNSLDYRLFRQDNLCHVGYD